MDDTVGVTIPLDPDAAKALDSPARREAAGRYLSRLLKSDRVRDVLAEAIAEAKSRGARQRPVGQEIDDELEVWRVERRG